MPWKGTLRFSPVAETRIETLRSKRQVALASSASPATVELFLKASGCDGLFSTVLNATSVDRHKPAPDIYLKACEMLRD